MKQDTVQFDDNGNFRLDGDIEVQWMKLHRDIQAEYRIEQLQAFLKGTAIVGGIVAVGFVLLQVINHWRF